MPDGKLLHISISILFIDMRPKFTIIIPTYKRPTEVVRAVRSVQKQTYPGWNLYVVIDDTESDYQELLAESQQDNRINIIRNDRNLGKNRSLNKVLENLSIAEFDGYVVYLDDDDWFSPDCLKQFAGEIIENPSPGWIVSNRVIEPSGKSLTKSTIEFDFIHYLRDNLVGRKITGDATHCIHFPTTKHCRYSSKIKNAEEWLYFSQVAVIHPHFKYINSTGTFTYGYEGDGLTAHQDEIRSVSRTKTLFKESVSFKILNPYLCIYLGGRIVKTLLYKLNRLFDRGWKRYFGKKASQ